MDQQFEITKVQQDELLEDLLDAIDSMEAEEAGIDAEASDAFVIDTTQQANYAVRKVKEIRQQMEEIQATAKKELEDHAAKVKEWEARQMLSLEYSEQYFASRLESYARQHIDPNGKKKSLSLINGSIGFRKQPDSYDYTDEKALLAKLKEKYPDLVENKPTIKKAELKKTATVKDGALYINGELIPGVTVTSKPDNFEVK